MADTESLARWLKQLTTSAAGLDAATERLTATSAISEPPPLLDENDLAMLIRRLDESVAGVARHAGNISALSAELDQVSDQLRVAAADRCCPVCGGALDANRLIAQAMRRAEGHDHV
jgi:hypothetical protein